MNECLVLLRHLKKDDFMVIKLPAEDAKKLPRIWESWQVTIFPAPKAENKNSKA